MRVYTYFLFFMYLILSGAPAIAETVDQAIHAINTKVKNEGYSIRSLAKADFAAALNQQKKFLFPKKLRNIIDTTLSSGIMDPGLQFRITAFPGSSFEPRIDLSIYGYIVILIQSDTLAYLDNTPEIRANCDGNYGFCDESNFSPNLKEPPSRIPKFIYSVKTKPLSFSEAQVRERHETKGFQQNSLEVTLRLEKSSIPNIVNYFEKGQNEKKLTQFLLDRLGTKSFVSMDLKEIMPPAVKQALYKFPGSSDNDVCYNAASTFYSSSHDRGDNSTELLESIIDRFYCIKADESKLRFGDILYAGGHVVRYIMYDDHANKHIVYQMNSGGWESWRFLYLEEAFDTGSDFPMENLFNEWIDIYGRCK